MNIFINKRIWIEYKHEAINMFLLRRHKLIHPAVFESVLFFWKQIFIHYI